MILVERVKRLCRKPVVQDTRSRTPHEEALERLAAKLRCVMFLHGMCIGGALTALCMLHAYGLLAFVVVFQVIWFAWDGWPWEMRD
jgi:hypothetical protein